MHNKFDFLFFKVKVFFFFAKSYTRLFSFNTAKIKPGSAFIFITMDPDRIKEKQIKTRAGVGVIPMAGRSSVGAWRSLSLAPLMWKGPMPPVLVPVRGRTLSEVKKLTVLTSKTCCGLP